MNIAAAIAERDVLCTPQQLAAAAIAAHGCDVGDHDAGDAGLPGHTSRSLSSSSTRPTPATPGTFRRSSPTRPRPALAEALAALLIAPLGRRAAPPAPAGACPPRLPSWILAALLAAAAAVVGAELDVLERPVSQLGMVAPMARQVTQRSLARSRGLSQRGIFHAVVGGIIESWSKAIEHAENGDYSQLMDLGAELALDIAIEAVSAGGATPGVAAKRRERSRGSPSTRSC